MKVKIALISLVLAQPVLADTAYADLSAIDQAVVRYTGQPLGAPGGAAAPVDRRLRLMRCGVPLALTWYGSQHDAVQVDCPLAGGWRLYVPLVTTQAGPTTAPAIQRGDAISISVAGDGFAVAQPGEALESGAVGTWIKVRTLDARAQPLRARVLAPGQAGIDLP